MLSLSLSIVAEKCSIPLYYSLSLFEEGPSLENILKKLHNVDIVVNKQRGSYRSIDIWYYICATLQLKYNHKPCWFNSVWFRVLISVWDLSFLKFFQILFFFFCFCNKLLLPHANFSSLIIKGRLYVYASVLDAELVKKKFLKLNVKRLNHLRFKTKFVHNFV